MGACIAGAGAGPAGVACGTVAPKGWGFEEIGGAAAEMALCGGPKPSMVCFRPPFWDPGTTAGAAAGCAGRGAGVGPAAAPGAAKGLGMPSMVPLANAGPAAGCDTGGAGVGPGAMPSIVCFRPGAPAPAGGVSGAPHAAQAADRSGFVVPHRGQARIGADYSKAFVAAANRRQEHPTRRVFARLARTSIRRGRRTP